MKKHKKIENALYIFYPSMEGSILSKEKGETSSIQKPRYLLTNYFAWPYMISNYVT